MTLILGNKDDIEDMSNSSSVVLTTVLKLINKTSMAALSLEGSFHQSSSCGTVQSHTHREHRRNYLSHVEQCRNRHSTTRLEIMKVPEEPMSDSKGCGRSFFKQHQYHREVTKNNPECDESSRIEYRLGQSRLHMGNRGSELYYLWRDTVTELDHEAHVEYKWPGENVRSMVIRLARTEHGAEVDDIAEHVDACNSRC
ncbi:hypothetical protein Pint_34003 [Pistacia integerrima]|uniref:Uncharacterized protein n=1 Tax=Pistacia integerrima TaxID=434235 RepID=A0ACC0X5A7_9ROSI|nr:hypothetical protein Pint_34003 [Pistacia integerrima]